ncbi:hypothetical protein KIPB_000705 [Kipferlia bialata]|uniref:CAP-Gly domain-containing protein n=1 Tax=Kipferlia bialata TaxID=797122 RepID=A0A391NU58_9EUKA|nr:hypothetical protein KIPB_000705 [Kipferlia bialata]|eukprot:g705.t1
MSDDIVGRRLQSVADASLRGTVAYYGQVKESGSSKLFYGVAWDTPAGKYDGEFKGTRYFTCEPNHGAFLAAKKVTLGRTLHGEMEFKYITEGTDLVASADASDTQTVGSMSTLQGNVLDVEFVGARKTLNKQSLLHTLTHIGLHGSGVNGVFGGMPGPREYPE